MSQASMFPLTEEERMSRIRSQLAKEEERTKTKRDTAVAALDDATEKWIEASDMLKTFDAMTSVVAAAQAAYATPNGVDPTTGEVDPDLAAAIDVVGAENVTVEFNRGSGSGVLDQVMDEAAKQINAGAMGDNVTAIVRPA